MSTLHPATRRARLRSPANQRGVTLVELMVALVIGLFIALASAAALIVARQGFTAVDSGGQLRENARFTADLMQRIVVQAGFDDIASGYIDRDPASGAWPLDAKWPGIQGYDDAFLAKDPADLSTLANGTRSANLGACGSSSTTDTACANASDIVVVRFGGSSATINGTADGGIIDCAGNAEPHFAPDGTAGTRAYSIFHLVRTLDGEPALACTYRDPASVTPVFKTQTLVKGVENMQILYGTDGVTPNTPPPTGATGMGGTVDRYLTARDIEVPGNATATTNNWRRVRSLRIALLFRGDVGSMSTRVAKAFQMRDVTGLTFQSTSDSPGNALAVQADGRLRQTMIFTVHLRNQQGYDQ